MTTTTTRERYDIPVEPKAGKVGVAAVFVFGVLTIVAVWTAAYLWTNGDSKLAAAIGIASVMIPTIAGYMVSEARHQRSGAIWFVVVAAIMVGSFSAWSLGERDDYDNRVHLIAPDADIPGGSGATAAAP